MVDILSKVNTHIKLQQNWTRGNQSMHMENDGIWLR